MRKRIGLTGGTGFIGQQLIRDFGDEYEFVAVTSRDDCSGLCQKAEYRKTAYDASGFTNAFGDCEALVHLGASIPGRVTDTGSMADYYENVLSSEALFSAAGKCSIRQIINISSVSVYNKKEQMPLKESMRMKPDNSYGLSKATVEMMSDIYKEKYGYSVTTLRVSQVLGYKKRLRNLANGFYSMLFSNALCDRDITILGKGIAARDYIYVRDVCGAIACSLERPEKSGAYNIGSGKATSNTALAQAFVSGMKSNSNIVHLETNNEDDRYWFMDISRAQKELGFSVRFDAEAMAWDMKREMELAEGLA